ncbi:hypothetical protein [Streptomyces sp. NPDC101249]|uniref:hypothetical protein n=1 Tax=Streptomyces sp. NPDC101249 TaxID=3366140 RepID=UPI00380703B1
MENYGLTWTDSTGTPRASVVAYDQPSADHKKQQLEAGGATRVEITPIKLGEQVQPKA